MNPRDSDRTLGNTRRRTHLDIAAHVLALLSSFVGGFLLESVILVASTAHHMASLGFKAFFKEIRDEKTWYGRVGSAYVLIQLAIWLCCLMLALSAVAMGAHGVFHDEPLFSLAMAACAAPGVAAAITTASLPGTQSKGGLKFFRLDMFFSTMPSVLAFGVAFGASSVQAGMLDSIVGFVVVLLLCARVLIHLDRILV